MRGISIAMVCTVSAALVSGCIIRKDDVDDGSTHDDCNDYGFYDDGTGASGQGGSGNASGGGLPGEGDPCASSLDCQGGLVCDVTVGECVPEPDSCSANAQCGPGCYCDEDNACSPSGLCIDHADCADGFICDFALATCVPGEIACQDLADEAACSARADCEPIYAGIDCSCGPDCTCIGGEPGCVCETFEFFTCESTEVP